MPEATAGGSTAGTGEGSLYEHVLDAMTTGMVTQGDSVTPADVHVPAGEPITATSQQSRPGEAEVRYHLHEHLIATRTFRVDERAGEVILGQFVLAKYEDLYNGLQNATGIHGRFVANLAGVPCVLRTTLTGDNSVLWAPYFDWDKEMENANAASLSHAVESLYPIVATQTVWDASDLPERIRFIAAPAPGSPNGKHGQAISWRDLVATTTPARLVDGINAINPGLAKVVFDRMSAWYAQRVLPP